ncbi:MAG: PadR family transcriptional regulator, partial [Halobacteriales archaeon]|nr:PadR family transcriptional regulator [Halobacteriales archaeon]
MPRETLGEFEKLVMLAVLRLRGDAYGAEILRELEERAGRVASAGAAYVALRRLERKDMVASALGESTPGRGGRPKRYYTVRPEGVEALREARSQWDALSEGLDDVLGT